MTADPLLSLEGVSKSFAKRAMVTNRTFALSGVDLTVHKGEVVGLLGESGSGKSTVAGIVTRLLEYDGGTYRFDGRDVAGFGRKEGFAFKSRVQIVFQDPYGSLNPRATARRIVREALDLHQPQMRRAEKDERVAALFEEVGISTDGLDRYPHEFSGGQRQRIAIARALAVGPELLVCDEPLSSLDVSIQAQILELFHRLIRDHDLTMIFISHDINVSRMICDRVYVMHEGRVVEQGNAAEVLTSPREDYTRRLVEAVY